MSKIARALILAVMVAVLPLAGMTAVAYAQANDQGTPSQQELAERWNTDNPRQATHMSPTQHKAWLQANAAQRELSDRWAYYSHATRCRRPNSRPGRRPGPRRHPDREDRPGARPGAAFRAERAAPACHRRPGGARGGAGGGGWAGPAGRPARHRLGAGVARDLATVTVTHAMGLPRPPAAPSPCRQPCIARLCGDRSQHPT